MNMKTILAGIFGVVLGLGIAAFVPAFHGVMEMMPSHGMNHSEKDMSAPRDATAATIAFMQANDAMHRDMAITFSGNADIDFAKGMIPHHQGAIDMAKIVLEHGNDAEIRKLAEGVVAAQDSEIEFMKGWLAKNGG